MRILYIAQRIPYPPNKGDKLRSFNEIKMLSKQHRVTLLCLTDSLDELSNVKELLPYCESVEVAFLSKIRSKIQAVLALFSNKPLTLAYFYSDHLKSIVSNKVTSEKFDLIFVYCSSMAQYVDHCNTIPKIIDFVDVDSEKWAQYSKCTSFPMNIIYEIESQRLRKYEAFIAKTFQHCILVSEKETADFTKLVSTGSNITPVMNGVDTTMFSCDHVNYNREYLVFTGAMDYYANVEAVLYFVNCILPLIKEVVPNVKFYVVGSNPTPKILGLPSEFPNVTVTGYVDSVKTYVVNSAVFVAPMRIARGVQNKILEAMAMGVPVVTSSLGFEGLACLPGRDIYVEDQPERFASQVLRLMHDDELRNTTAAHALKTIKENYNWTDNLEKLTQVIDLATAR